MAMRLDSSHFGDIYDHWGGLNDLKQKKVRVLHSLSFVDDPTRMLRAIRFEQRFMFDIEKRTLELFREATPLLGDVSGDRIRHELDQILGEGKAIAMLSRIGKLGLFTHIHPSISWNEFTRKGLEELFTDHPTKEWIEYLCLDTHKRLIQGAYTILLMTIPPSDMRKVIKRLRFKSDLQNTLSAANYIWYNKPSLSSLNPGKFCLTLEKYPPLAVYSNWITEEKKDLREKIKRFICQWRLIYPETTGDDLKQRGIPPGPIYHSILQKLRIAWINEEITSKEQEKQLLEKILSKIS
jgi:tRNA nucleotidyltransferase (CCA-adding enzyme)